MSAPKIDAYRFGKIVNDGQDYTKDIIILPGRIIPNWWRKSGHNLSVDDLKSVFEAQPQVLVIGQGALGIEIRKGDACISEIVHSLDDPETHIAVTAERAFLNRLEGGCQVPIAALAKVQGPDDLTLAGMVASLDGAKMIRDKISAPPNKANEIGVELAERLLSRGADEILKEILARNEAKSDTSAFDVDIYE